MEIKVGQNTFSVKKGTVDYSLPKYENKIWRFKLAKDHQVEIGGHPFIFKKDSQVVFYKSENIEQGFLAKKAKVKIGNHNLTLNESKKDWDGIHFYESGEIERCYLAKNSILKIKGVNLKFKGGAFNETEELHFYKSGRLKMGELAEIAPLKIRKQALHFIFRIGFYENEALSFGSLSKDTVIAVGKNRINFQGGRYWQIEFYSDGRVARATLSGVNKINVGGYSLSFRNHIDFDKKSRVKRGVLAEDALINGIPFKEGKPLVFEYDEKGKVKKASVYQYPER